jgi:hypothetical protein
MEFCCDSFLCEPSLAASQAVESFLDLCVDTAKESWNRWEQGGFERSTIICKFEWVALVEADLKTDHASIE